MGPSLIISLGDHTGGKLWTIDMGEIDCHRQWQRFNGKLEHETLPFTGIGIQQKGSGRFIHLDMAPAEQLPRPMIWSY